MRAGATDGGDSVCEGQPYEPELPVINLGSEVLDPLAQWVEPHLLVCVPLCLFHEGIEVK